VDHLDTPSASKNEALHITCELQSDEVTVVLDGSESSTTTSATVVEFMDEFPGSEWGIPHLTRSNLDDRQAEIELAKYLSRPVLIKSHVWAQTDSYVTTTTWYPWHLFFNSTPIKNKLNNYSFINCSLKLKFVINASPFYSGAMAFTYCPLQNLNGTTIIADAAGTELMGYSQRPKVWIFPQTCQGGALELPFFYHKNWLDITVATDTQDMGTITPCLFAPLVSANGITGTSVVVNVYAWAENVKLHAPTIKLAMQSDEFDYKPSQISSAVSKAAGNLSRVPLIGPYMKATSAVTKGFSNFASSLGFTNVPNIDKVDSFKQTPFPQNSTCDISVPLERASVDPKNEVTLDPRTVGLDGKDELAINYIASKECYLGSAILASSDAVDALTLVSRVTPALFYRYSSVTPNQYTPMGYLCEMFNAWRGDIIFRFKFICTRFHKGRVRITFDPKGDISTSVPDYTTVFNEIVDIGAEQDIEVRVPYMQAKTYLDVNLVTGNYNFSGTSLSPDVYSNGLITMRVVNPLSGPIATTAIPVLVFVRGAENLEYAWPTVTTSQATTLSPYTLQSDEISYSLDPKQVIAGNSVQSGDPNRNLIHFGESIVSLRPLIHRMTYQYTVQPSDVSTSNTLTMCNLWSSRRIKYPGFTTNGLWAANKTLSAGVAYYFFNKVSILQLTSLMYIGQRGSMNWSYNIEGLPTNVPSNVSLKRFDAGIVRASYNDVVTSTSTSGSEMTRLYCVNNSDYNSGTVLTDQRNQPGIAMNFPYYSLFNFQFTNPANAIVGSINDGTDSDNIHLQIMNLKPSAANTLRVNVWGSCGHDYNFFFFINTPSLYQFAIPTVL